MILFVTVRKKESFYRCWIQPINFGRLIQAVSSNAHNSCIVFVIVVVVSMNLLVSRCISWFARIIPRLLITHPRRELWHILFVTGEGRKRDSQGRVKKTEGKGGEWSYVKFEFAFFSTILKMFKGFYDKICHFLSSCAASWSKFDLSSADETFSISKSKSYTL